MNSIRSYEISVDSAALCNGGVSTPTAEGLRIGSTLPGRFDLLRVSIPLQQTAIDPTPLSIPMLFVELQVQVLRGQARFRLCNGGKNQAPNYFAALATANPLCVQLAVAIDPDATSCPAVIVQADSDPHNACELLLKRARAIPFDYLHAKTLLQHAIEQKTTLQPTPSEASSKCAAAVWYFKSHSSLQAYLSCYGPTRRLDNIHLCPAGRNYERILAELFPADFVVTHSPVDDRPNPSENPTTNFRHLLRAITCRSQLESLFVSIHRDSTLNLVDLEANISGFMVGACAERHGLEVRQFESRRALAIDSDVRKLALPKNPIARTYCEYLQEVVGVPLTPTLGRLKSGLEGFVEQAPRTRIPLQLQTWEELITQFPVSLDVDPSKAVLLIDKPLHHHAGYNLEEVRSAVKQVCEAISDRGL